MIVSWKLKYIYIFIYLHLDKSINICIGVGGIGGGHYECNIVIIYLEPVNVLYFEGCLASRKFPKFQ